MMFRLLALALLLAPANLLAHAAHSTLAEVEVDEGRLEVALQLRVADIDVAFTNIKVKAGTYEEAVRKLVTPHLRLKDADGKLIPFAWVGIEEEGFGVWVYLQWNLKEPLSTYSLSNTLFYDVDMRTVHVVNFKKGKERAALSFRHGEEWKAIPEFKGSATPTIPTENSPSRRDGGTTEAP